MVRLHLLLASALVAVGCVISDVELSGKRCPCTGSWRCDEPSNTCVPLVSGPFTLSVAPQQVRLHQGGSADVTVTLVTSIAQSITVSLAGLPSDVAASPGALSLSASTPSGVLHLTAGANAALGTAHLGVEGTGARGERSSFPVELEILGRPGSLDQSFGTAGFVEADPGAGQLVASAIAVRPDGAILVAGYVTDSAMTYPASDQCFVAQLTPEGKWDPAFGTGGFTGTALPGGCFASAMALEPDGKAVVVGYTYPTRLQAYAIVRFESDGPLDPGFGSAGVVVTSPGAVTGVATAVAIAPDGKIVVAGSAVGSTTNDLGLVRCRSDGTLDPTFSSDGMEVTSFGSTEMGETPHAILVQPDARIVIGGVRHSDPWQAIFARYSAEGQIEPTLTSLGIPGLESSLIHALAVDPDGNVLAAGDIPMGMLSESSGNFVVRHLASGALDPSFGDAGVTRMAPAQFSHPSLLALLPQADQRIVVVDQHFIAVLDPSGQLDEQLGYLPSPASGPIVAAAQQGGGKLLLLSTIGDASHYSFAVTRTWL